MGSVSGQHTVWSMMSTDVFTAPTPVAEHDPRVIMASITASSWAKAIYIPSVTIRRKVCGLSKPSILWTDISSKVIKCDDGEI